MATLPTAMEQLLAGMTEAELRKHIDQSQAVLNSRKSNDPADHAAGVGEKSWKKSLIDKRAITKPDCHKPQQGMTLMIFITAGLREAAWRVFLQLIFRSLNILPPKLADTSAPQC